MIQSILILEHSKLLCRMQDIWRQSNWEPCWTISTYNYAKQLQQEKMWMQIIQFTTTFYDGKEEYIQHKQWERKSWNQNTTRNWQEIFDDTLWWNLFLNIAISHKWNTMLRNTVMIVIIAKEPIHLGMQNMDCYILSSNPGNHGHIDLLTWFHIYLIHQSIWIYWLLWIDLWKWPILYQ